MRIIFSLLIICGLFCISSCYYDSVDILYPNTVNNGNCDTTNYKYSSAVSKIISDNCLTCHNSNIQNGSVNLEGYANAKIYADNGKINSVIQWTGASNMPPAGKLPECNITILQKWLQAGAQNN